jgi:peptide/nickel transport system substrate-binding protein
MKTRFYLFATLLITAGLAAAQPILWPEAYAPTATAGGTIQETFFGDVTTLQPYVGYGSASETAMLSLVGGSFNGGPDLVYRDWLGTRSFRDEEGNFNLFWAREIEELEFEKDFIITLREGWLWSDGTEMTADDVIAGRTIIGDPAVEANELSCSLVDEEPIVVEKLGRYQLRLSLPQAVPNALSAKWCPVVPAHIFMPIYEAQGASGIRQLYNVDADPTTIVSGGPYLLTEFLPGQRLIFERNPHYGEFVQAADGSPLPGPQRWVVTIVEDRNAELALVTTGQASFYWPTTLDEVRAVQDAVNRGVIPGNMYANIGPETSVDFITYNFNNTDTCKREMFRNTSFRQAISLMINREALVQAAVGGLGFPARNYSNDGLPPFHAPGIPHFEFDPEQGVQLLSGIGFTQVGSDGVLLNPETGCRAAFDLQFNSGNTRRGQLALVIAQTLAPYGVQINVREVSVDIWSDAITGDLDYDETGRRKVDFDAQVWGLAGGDVDNPHSTNVLGINTNLNNWNKSRVDVEPWEIQLDRLSREMQFTLELDARVALHEERAELLRQYLPITPLISPAFHFYEHLSHVWPHSTFDAKSIERPYTPGNFRSVLAVPDR